MSSQSSNKRKLNDEGEQIILERIKAGEKVGFLSVFLLLLQVNASLPLLLSHFK